MQMGYMDATLLSSKNQSKKQELKTMSEKPVQLMTESQLFLT
jgi:hypothetical protein